MVLTVLLVVIGIQIFLILGEFRRALEKMNQALDDVKTTVDSTGQAIQQAVEKLTDLSGVASLISWLINQTKRRRDENERE